MLRLIIRGCYHSWLHDSSNSIFHCLGNYHSCTRHIVTDLGRNQKIQGSHVKISHDVLRCWALLRLTPLSWPTGAEHLYCDQGVMVDYNTADPLIRWDSYENMSADGEGECHFLQQEGAGLI